jgi:hypothetical protein
MVVACHYSATSLRQKKKRAVQAIASARHVALYNKSGKLRKKATLIRKILGKSYRALKLKKRRSVGPHLRYNPSKKCRSLVITRLRRSKRTRKSAAK